MLEYPRKVWMTICFKYVLEINMVLTLMSITMIKLEFFVILWGKIKKMIKDRSSKRKTKSCNSICDQCSYRTFIPFFISIKLFQFQFFFIKVKNSQIISYGTSKILHSSITSSPWWNWRQQNENNSWTEARKINGFRNTTSSKDRAIL